MTFDHDFFSNPLVQIIITIAAASFLQLISQNFIERIVRRAVLADRFETKLDEKKREDTVIGIFHRVFVTLVWLIAVLTVLTILNVNVAAFLTGAGLFGVIVGLGAQNTIKDYLAGMYILTENQYRVGDIVTLSGGTTSQLGASGVVEEITLRITRLRDLDGNINIVRNGEAGVITNKSFRFSSVVISIMVDYESDLDKVENVINAVGVDMLRDESLNALIIEPVKFFRVEDFTDSGVNIQCLGKVKPGQQWEVASRFRRALKSAFDAADVDLAVPHRIVRNTK
jgi:small-conductance mechanosensitive channel